MLKRDSTARRNAIGTLMSGTNWHTRSGRLGVSMPPACRKKCAWTHSLADGPTSTARGPDAPARYARIDLLLLKQRHALEDSQFPCRLFGVSHSVFVSALMSVKARWKTWTMSGNISLRARDGFPNQFWRGRALVARPHCSMSPAMFGLCTRKNCPSACT